MTPERIKAWPWNGKSNSGQWHVAGIGETTEYVRADLTPPAAVVEAMERALRHADQVSRDLGWHRIYDETGAALADLEAWRAGK